jgi:hypothetical protein
MENDFACFFDFRVMAEKATEKGKGLKFPKYTKNLRYNSEGIYSYNVKIANLNCMNRSIQKRGYWSPTTTKHFNYAKRILNLCYDFEEIEPAPVGGPSEYLRQQHEVLSMSYWDHT